MFKFIFTFIILLNISYADCGKLVTAVINYNSKTNVAVMDSFYKLDEEFCDAGKNELNANTNITLLDADKKIIVDKKVFFAKFLISEKMSKKDPNFFEKTKVAKTSQFYNVKFSVPSDAKIIKYYKITSLENGQVIGEGLVK